MVGVLMPIELHNPVTDRLASFALANLAAALPEMVRPMEFAGQSLALCGAGPSLRGATLDGYDRVWACNSALPYLVEAGAKVDAAVGIDQTPGLLREWGSAPDVTYLVASTCDPALVAHLRAHGRRVVFFHNCVGFDGEMHHYCEEWPPAFMVASGATVVSRVIGLAGWMGFSRVGVYGADCAFGAGDLVHANGDGPHEAYGNPLMMQGEIDGRVWRTRPDMLLGAVDLVRRVRASNGAIRLFGDTLPNALMTKDDAFLDEVMRILPPGTTPEDFYGQQD